MAADPLRPGLSCSPWRPAIRITAGPAYCRGRRRAVSAAWESARLKRRVQKRPTARLAGLGARRGRIDRRTAARRNAARVLVRTRPRSGFEGHGHTGGVGRVPAPAAPDPRTLPRLRRDRAPAVTTWPQTASRGAMIFGAACQESAASPVLSNHGLSSSRTCPNASPSGSSRSTSP